MTRQQRMPGQPRPEDVRAVARQEIRRALANGDLQAFSATLTAIAGLATAADRVAYFTGAGAAALATLTVFARTLLGAEDQAAALAAIGAAAADLTNASPDALTQPGSPADDDLVLVFRGSTLVALTLLQIKTYINGA